MASRRKTTRITCNAWLQKSAIAAAGNLGSWRGAGEDHPRHSVRPRPGEGRFLIFKQAHVLGCANNSSAISRIRNFCTFPVTVIGNTSTKCQKRGVL
jgi:hypothetical protein